MESIFSFRQSYFSTTFSAKGKIIKFINFFSVILGQSSFRQSDYKILNQIYPQSDEIVYFFAWWHQKLKIDRKILGSWGQKWF